MKNTNPKVDAFIARNKWQPEMKKLREILLAAGLNEEIKWGQPCYTIGDKNVLVMFGFKQHCGLGLFKGALLKDPKKLLTLPGENTQSARQMRFTALQEIVKNKAAIAAVVKDAVRVEKAGEKVKFKKIAEFKMPEELEKRLKADAKLKKAFQSLTPGRQRLYIMHFSQPKQSATREARIEKCVPLILKGKGLNDDYMKKKKK